MVSNDQADWLLDGAPDFLGGDHDGLRQAAHEVPAAYLRVRLILGRVRGPQGHLDFLGGAIAQHERVLLLDEGDDRLVELVSSNADRLEKVTMPPSEITATSVVPPPMSTTMFPVGSLIGSPAPMAAAIGSSMMSTGGRQPDHLPP